MNSEQIYLTKTSEETKKLAQNFAKTLKLGDFLAFYGNLGSGKTTFIQGLAEGLGVKRRISSPTFIIVRHYKLDKGSFYHIDLYRIKTENDLLGLGIEELIRDKKNIFAVEWSEKIGELLPQERYEIHCKYVKENMHEIKIKKYG